MADFSLADPVSRLPAVGPALTSRLSQIGVRTLGDLLYWLPFRYDDFSLVSPIAAVQEGETVTIKGTVLSMDNQYTRSAMVLQKAVVRDDSGEIEAVWFNQRFLVNVIRPNDVVSLSGKVKQSGRKFQLVAPQYEVWRGGDTVHTGRLVPIYSEPAGLSGKWLRGRIKFVIDLISSGQLKIEDYLPASVISKNSFPELSRAFINVHFPISLAQAEAARARLAFDEVLSNHVAALTRKYEWQQKIVGNKFDIVAVRNKLAVFVRSLPFSLTAAQKRVIDEIYKDLAKTVPMNRLLQGDVGSGKTVVAALAILAAYYNGYQAVLMAPTEILAIQHYQTLNAIFTPLNLAVGIATGSRHDYRGFDVVVGTHALLSDKLNFKKLGLVVIDEQHRFGVEQRAKLTAKGLNPHVLTMTATPIPRTVALTLYGDLDISIIDEMPKNRLPAKTWVVPAAKRLAAYEWIRRQKAQTYIVCPLIDGPASLAGGQGGSETLLTVKSAKAEFTKLSQEIFPDLRLGLLHGRLKPKEKENVINKFREGELDILVTTAVVEVGIDIPKATIMLIEGADHFGLAQLHQLRGRVGRGEEQSYCLLFTESDNPATIKRLKFLETLNSGLKLAEADLQFRGPGQRYGLAQHGKWDLKIANFNDLNLISIANSFATELFTDPNQDKTLRRLAENVTIGTAVSN